MRSWLSVLLLIALLTEPPTSHAFGRRSRKKTADSRNVTIEVHDSTPETGALLPGASVTLGTNSQITDSAGRAHFTLGDGRYPISAGREGFEPFSGTIDVFRRDKLAILALAPLAPSAPAQVRITGSYPSLTSDTRIEFTFEGTNAAYFRCGLDGAEPTNCTSPKLYENLAAGSHSFLVASYNSADQRGQDASFNWTIAVDTSLPTLTFEPTSRFTSSSAGFAFSSSNPSQVSGFQCRMDLGDFASCTSPKTYTGLLAGKHSFEVRMLDLAGSSVASRSHVWYVSDAVGALPAPNHAIDVGYYYIDGRYGDHIDEVRSMINLYVGGLIYDTDAPDWRPLLSTSLQKAAARGDSIYFQPENDSNLSDELEIARPYWNSVKYFEVCHEEDLDPAALEARIQWFKAQIASHGLSTDKLYAATECRKGAAAPSLQVTGYEGYVSPPGNSDTLVNVRALYSNLEAALSSTPPGKDILLITQAYDRNFQWQNIETLRDLQAIPYLVGYNDPRVKLIEHFSYARPGGSMAHPELNAVHRKISEKILGHK